MKIQTWVQPSLAVAIVCLTAGCGKPTVIVKGKLVQGDKPYHTTRVDYKTKVTYPKTNTKIETKIYDVHAESVLEVRFDSKENEGRIKGADISFKAEVASDGTFVVRAGKKGIPAGSYNVEVVERVTNWREAKRGAGFKFVVTCEVKPGMDEVVIDVDRQKIVN